MVVFLDYSGLSLGHSKHLFQDFRAVQSLGYSGYSKVDSSYLFEENPYFLLVLDILMGHPAPLFKQRVLPKAWEFISQRYLGSCGVP